MPDWTSTLRYGPRTCPHCGVPSLRTARHCAGCGERIRGGNPLVRFLVTIIALAVVAGVIWFKVFR